jgi:hypothetical protein
MTALRDDKRIVNILSDQVHAFADLSRISIVKFDFVLAKEVNPVASRRWRRYFQAAYGTKQE